MSVQGQRAERARRGSRRKRDLEALRAEEGPVGVFAPDDTRPDDRAVTAWTDALDALRDTEPFGAVENWLDPMTVLGTSQGRIVVTGSPAHVAWCRKRYASALDELVPDGVLICDGEQS